MGVIRSYDDRTWLLLDKESKRYLVSTSNEQVARSWATTMAKENGGEVELMEYKPQFRFRARVEESDLRPNEK